MHEVFLLDSNTTSTQNQTPIGKQYLKKNFSFILRKDTDYFLSTEKVYSKGRTWAEILQDKCLSDEK